MLSILAWWAIPLGVGVLATCAVAITVRLRSRSDALDGVEAHRRFRAAMERTDKADRVGTRR